jgi:hypothetical protein
MSLEDKVESSSSDQPIETAKDEPVNKRASCHEVNGDDDDDGDHQNNENDDSSNPQKKKPKRQEETDEADKEEEEDAVSKARKVLEMFRKEFGEDDDAENDEPAATGVEGDKENHDKEKAGDPAPARFQRKPIILQDDDPCLL